MDRYTHYEAGLHALMKQVQRGHPRAADARFYQQRLLNNIHDARAYGDTEPRRAERSVMLQRLDEIAHAVVGISFYELCELNMPELPQRRRAVTQVLMLLAQIIAISLILAFIIASVAPAVPQPLPAPTPIPTQSPTATPILV
jgi:hypothetical protein